MTKEQAKQLKIGARVRFAPDEGERPVTGTVTEIGFNACRFDWDDGQFNGNIIRHESMADYEVIT